MLARQDDALTPSSLSPSLARADYEARTQGAFVEKKVSSVTFHYRNADPVFGLFQGALRPCPSLFPLWLVSDT